MASTRKCFWQDPCLPGVGIGGVKRSRPVPQPPCRWLGVLLASPATVQLG